jgi:4-amino-4-deoxy-L-arabinose transferase-like glycosyltransferase
MMPFVEKYKYHLVVAAFMVVYFVNMFIDIMDIDAAQYALISMEMSWTKSFLQVYQQGHDYLDKPPLLFWLSSLSFMGLGISNFAYKLPSVLIAVLGIYSTYRFALLWYSREKAIVSALVLATCQALFLMTNDVRTDTNLLGLTMFAVWQLSAYLNTPNWKHLVLTAIGIGGAMMAKGPIALVIPAAAFGSDLLLKRQWKNIFKWQWILLLIMIALLLLPMSYGLYTQFDLHPEKTVYGLQGPSGLRFYYWTQSFGRITGENYWNNHTGPYFFLHTILWDFQPWILLFIPALVSSVVKLVKQRFKASANQEFITLGGFIMMFIALSMSNYKLPHYIFVLFPFAAIITTNFVFDLKEQLQNRIAKIQFAIMHLFWVMMVVCFILFFAPTNAWLPVVLAALYGANLYLFLKLKSNALRLFIPTMVTAIAFNLLMGSHFYPHLLQYQSTSQIGKFVEENHVPADKFCSFELHSFSLDFYARRITPIIKEENIADIKKGMWVAINTKNLEKIDKAGLTYKTVKAFDHYKVTRLKPKFLNKNTRPQTLDKLMIVEIL